MDLFSIAALQTGVALVSSTVGTIGQVLDLRSKIRDVASTEEPAPILEEFLANDSGRFFKLSLNRNRDGAGIRTIYAALDRSQPLAETLLKRLQGHAAFLGAGIILFWSLCAFTLASLGFAGWFGVTVLGVFGLLLPHILSPRVRTQRALSRASLEILQTTAENLSEQLRAQSSTVRALLWNPLSSPEVAFLEEYLAARNLVMSLEAAALKTQLELGRRPLFELYQASVRDLVAQALRELHRAGQLQDPRSQAAVLKAELRQLGLGDLAPNPSSNFWRFDFARATSAGVAFEDVVVGMLGISGDANVGPDALLEYVVPETSQ